MKKPLNFEEYVEANRDKWFVRRLVRLSVRELDLSKDTNKMYSSYCGNRELYSFFVFEPGANEIDHKSFASPIDDMIDGLIKIRSELIELTSRMRKETGNTSIILKVMDHRDYDGVNTYEIAIFREENHAELKQRQTCDWESYLEEFEENEMKLMEDDFKARERELQKELDNKRKEIEDKREELLRERNEFLKHKKRK